MLQQSYYPPYNNTCSGTPTLAMSNPMKTSCTGTKFVANTTLVDATFGNFRMSLCTAPITSPTGPPQFMLSQVPPGSSTQCFAGTELLTLESGDMKAMSDADVADRVLVYSKERGFTYSPIIALPHPANDEPAFFAHVQMLSGNDIKMTRDHLVLAGKCGSALSGKSLTKAYALRVGDCLATVARAEDKIFAGACAEERQPVREGEDEIVAVDVQRGTGIYTVVRPRRRALSHTSYFILHTL
jgi:hypothetical protein